MMKHLGEHFKTKIKYVEREHQVILIEMDVKNATEQSLD